ncbi:MAG: hypothetical protein U1E62_25440 [Alsobacter sp.]
MKRLVGFALLALLLAGPALALEPQRRDAIVASMRAWDGYQYKETFLPSNLPEMTLVAGRASAVVFVRTQEYFWPLSRQVYVDFDTQRDVVQGVLRIERDDAVVAEEPLQAYAVLYPEGAINGDGRLLWGAEAEAAYAAEQLAQRDFSQRYDEALRAQADYERRLFRSAAARSAGGQPDVLPPPPALPQPSLRLVTRPAAGFRVDLPPGRYRVSVVRDGVPVAGGARSLRVVSAAGRDDIVADIVPEERWTRPLASNSARSRIYARPGATFYVALAEATRFDEADYLPVVSPQEPAVAGRETWVRRKPSDLRAIERDGEVLALERLKVDQTRGSSFGYKVRRAVASENPDLTAFAVTVPASTGSARFQLTAPDVPFLREVVPVRPRDAALGLALAFAPAFIACVLAIRRRRG